jgi:putative DNA primase/helicase
VEKVASLGYLKRLVDPQEVKRAYQLLTTPGQVVEMRALESSKDHNGRYRETLGGYFDNIDDLLREISKIRLAVGIYITLQPCHPDLLHRAKNKLIRQKKDYSTPDKYITAYRWLPIDSDPERVSNISSTEEEHEKAIAHSLKIRQALSELGWPEPVLTDSGNGSHLLYPIDEPVSNPQFIKRVLEGLAHRFDEDGIHVDQGLFNPSRIIKLYGTLACKGDDTDERPHRLSRILEIPDQLQVVSHDLLEAIAIPIETKAIPYKISNNDPKPSAVKSFSMEDFIYKHEIRIKSSSPYNGGTRYLLEACAWDPSHTDNSACLYDMPDGFGASCSHNSCKGKHWRDFRLIFEPDAYDRQSQTDWQSKSYAPTPESEAAYYNEEPKQPPLDRVLQRLAENEWGDALLFAEVFQGRIVYDASNKEWYRWNEHYWKLDNTNFVRQLVSGHLGSIYMKAAAEANVKWAELEAEISRLPKDSSKIGELEIEQTKLNEQMDALKKRCYALRSAKRNLAVLGFTQTDPRMVVTGNMWDTDKWSLPVQNGVIDLRTGNLRPGKPHDYIRTVASVTWDGINAPYPRFEKFLDEIFEDRLEDDRKDLIEFLQRLLGYAITGLSEEAIFPILYGEEGRNGKDTLMALLRSILGALAGAVSNDLFVDNKAARAAGSATPHICDLQGRRIVWGSETKQGDKLNIAQIKLFTGGGDISARQLHGKQFSFSPTHTLLLMTNHRPHADADENAFWTRACLIEFKIRFLDEDEVQGPYDRVKEEGLKRRLMSELSGILAWLVRGCLAWQEQGFKQPASVRMATAAYRKSEDQLQQFIDECCYVHPPYMEKAQRLYMSYVSWCNGNRLTPMNNNLFSEKISKRFKKDKKKFGNVYLGLGLIGQNPPPPDTENGGSGGGLNAKGGGPNEVLPPYDEAASEAALDGMNNPPSGSGGSQNEFLALYDPREYDPGPKIQKRFHPSTNGSSDRYLKPLVEPVYTKVEAQNSASTNGNSNGHLDQLIEPVYTKVEAQNSASTQPPPDLLQEYRDLYKQLQQIPPEELAPLGTVHWYVPDSDMETGPVSTREYAIRLQALGRSKDLRKVTAGRDEMLRKLKGLN